ncbi:MAG: leucine-rich repeat protein [Prevotellaceae bacterium]|nr:leucine-rich repeat protein [Prevotellaceae bacterium]
MKRQFFSFVAVVLFCLTGYNQAFAQTTTEWWHKNVAKYTEGGVEKTVPVYYRINEYWNETRSRNEGTVTKVHFKTVPPVPAGTAILLEFPHDRQEIFPTIADADAGTNKNYHTITRIGQLNGEGQTVKLPKENFPALYEMVIGEKIEQMVANLEDNYPSGVCIQALTIKSTNLKEIPALMCQNCSKLKKLIFAQGCKVGAIGKDAFANTGLVEVEIPTNIPVIAGYAFEQNHQLTKVVFKDRDNGAGPVTQETGQYAFAFSENITSVVFEHGVKSIGANAFFHSPINQPIPFPEGLEAIGSLAFYAAKIKGDLKLPSSLKLIGNGVFGQNPGAPGWVFYNGIQLPDHIEVLGGYAFVGSRKAQNNIVIPNTVKEIGNFCFGAAPLTGTLTIPSSVTTIGGSAFGFCGGLDYVKFEENSTLTSLGDKVFTGCNGLRYIDMTKVNSASLLASLQPKKVSRGNGTFNQLPNYTLVYLPDNFTYGDKASFMADNQVNFIMKDGAGYRCDDFKVYDNDTKYQSLNLYHLTKTQMQENSTTAAELDALEKKYPYSVRGCDYEIPYPFTADKAAYERAFTGNALNIFSISLPYDGAQLANGVKAFKLVNEMDLEGSKNNKGLWFVSLDDSRLTNKSANESANKLDGNHPYVLRFTDTGLLGTHKFTATNTEVKSTQNMDEPTDGSLWRFVNTNVNIYNADAAAQKLYMLEGGTKTWHAVSTSNSAGFFHSFRGAMKYMGTGAAKAFPGFLEDSEPTGLTEVTADGEMRIYTLDGRRVEGSFDAVAPGLYIVNGRKVVKH